MLLWKDGEDAGSPSLRFSGEAQPATLVSFTRGGSVALAVYSGANALDHAWTQAQRAPSAVIFDDKRIYAKPFEVRIEMRAAQRVAYSGRAT